MYFRGQYLDNYHVQSTKREPQPPAHRLTYSLTLAASQQKDLRFKNYLRSIVLSVFYQVLYKRVFQPWAPGISDEQGKAFQSMYSGLGVPHQVLRLPI